MSDMNDMNDTQDNDIERIDRYMDGLLSEAELRRFNADLLADGKLREQLVWSSLQGGVLEDRLASVQSERMSGAGQGRGKRRGKRGLTPFSWVGAWIGGAAAMVGMGFLIWSALVPAIAPRSVEAAPANLPIAVITHARGAQWLASNLPTDVGQPLPPGELKLAAGMAQIEFTSGATAILEGPAEFQLLSASRGYLRSGRLHAHVPLPAEGFAIQTPTTTAAATGPDYSLTVDKTGKADVHTYTPAELDGAASQRFRKLVDDSGQERYQAWLAHSAELAKDPSLLLYFTFGGGDPWSRAVANAAGTSRGVGEGAIVGCQWMQGRWPGKSALEFKRTTDRVRIVVPGEYESMTFAVWLRIDGFDRKWNSLMLTDDWDPGEPHWQISQEGEIILGVRSNPYVNYYSLRVLGQTDLGRWVHVATVYDGAAGRVTHYVDGKQVSGEAIVQKTKLRIGAAEIGNWRGFHGQVPAGTSLRNLNGRIDEFQLFSRAMTAAEIAQLFEAGKP